MYLVQGGNLVPGKCAWSGGGVPGLGGCVPGPGVCVPGLGGGVPGPGGYLVLGGYLVRYSPL